MVRKTGSSLFAAGLLSLSLLVCGPLAAQTVQATLSGTITSPAGQPVPNATVSAKNLATSQVTQAQTHADGTYSVANLPPGDYEITISAAGLSPKTANVTLAPGATQKMDLAFTALATTTPLTLGDLGFGPSAAKGSPAEQARLNRRTHMLKIHQELGMITLAPMVASLFTGGGAGRRGTTTSRDVHMTLGSVTAGMYFTTAAFAIFAPKIPGTQVHGQIRLHKALAWVHGTGMILLPILGTMAYEQLNKGEKVHGIAQYHGPVAAVTTIAYGLALVSVSFKF